MEARSSLLRPAPPESVKAIVDESFEEGLALTNNTVLAGVQPPRCSSTRFARLDSVVALGMLDSDGERASRLLHTEPVGLRSDTVPRASSGCHALLSHSKCFDSAQAVCASRMARTARTSRRPLGVCRLPNLARRSARSTRT